MVSLSLDTLKTRQICIKCAKRKDNNYFTQTKQLPLWFDSSGVARHNVPEELSSLTLAEKLLIQKISPFVPLEHIRQGVMGLKGHVCCFEQDISNVCCELPRLPTDVSIIRVVREIQAEIGNSSTTSTKVYRVNKQRILAALHWLKRHNKEYKEISIVESNLDWLSETEGELLSSGDIVDNDMFDPGSNNPTDTDFGPSGKAPEQAAIQHFGYVDHGRVPRGNTEIDNEKKMLIEAIDKSPSPNRAEVAWPSTGEKAVSEYSGTNIFAGAFPWLFPGGYGDINDAPKSTERDWGARMLLHQDARFARDPVFTFFANNYITRHLNSSSGKWFVDSFHQNAPETLQQLQESISAGNYDFVNSLTYYSKRVKGSPQYWYQKRSELYSWVNHHVEAGNGAPSFFITLSCAEHYWPDIIRLIKERMEMAGEDSSHCYIGSPKLSKILNDYCIVVQEFFQERVRVWLETVGKEVFGIDHYWVRYEFAPGRGQIHAHILCISGDKKLQKLTRVANAGEKEAEALACYARQKFGFVASASTEQLSGSTPMAQRFTEISENDRATDLNGLLLGCQIHQCSKFCMRKGTCKVGCGKESTANTCDTPGFRTRTKDSIEKDHRGITKLFITRDHNRLNQTSSYALQSWRGNCDVQLLLYKSRPEDTDISEIAEVVDYVIAYSCKGNATLKEELAQTKNLVMFSSELTGCQRDIHRVCKHVLNKAASSRLISRQEATVMLAGMPFTSTTESVENVSVSLSKSLRAPNTNKPASTQILPLYENRLKGLSPGSDEMEFLQSISLYDYFHLMKNVLPPLKKHKTIQYFKEMHRTNGSGKTMWQFFVSLKYKKHPNGANYVIPNFVGAKTRPCYPVTDQYARAVITIYKPWTVLPSPTKDHKHDFHVFINSKYCPKNVKMGYLRVLKRHLNKTTYLEPKHSKVDNNHNSLTEDDKELIELLGLQAEGINDINDEHNIRGLPRGKFFDWNKPTQVSYFCVLL